MVFILFIGLYHNDSWSREIDFNSLIDGNSSQRLASRVSFSENEMDLKIKLHRPKAVRTTQLKKKNLAMNKALVVKKKNSKMGSNLRSNMHGNKNANARIISNLSSKTMSKMNFKMNSKMNLKTNSKTKIQKQVSKEKLTKSKKLISMVRIKKNKDKKTLKGNTKTISQISFKQKHTQVGQLQKKLPVSQELL